MISALTFWRLFQPAVLKAVPTGYGANWTAGMYATLHLVQQQLGLWCQCLSHPDRNNGSSLRMRRGPG